VIGVGGVLSNLTNTTVADIAFARVIAAFAVIALFFEWSRFWRIGRPMTCNKIGREAKRDRRWNLFKEILD
jgi:hypothetical protein